MKYNTILFDLDGTLTDSRPGITKSAVYALESFGFTDLNPDELNFFIGPPLLDTFMQHYGFKEEKAHKAIAKFRERYNVTGVFENSAYEGIHEELRKLKEAGMTLAIATSKPHDIMLRVIERYELAPFFTAVEGSKVDDTGYRKSQILKEVFEDLHTTDLSKVLMVGDRFHDIEAANDCGIDSMGVLYGYGSREELESYHATYITENVSGLAKEILTCE
ncbi:Phosphoglycolate phosphatase [Lachnospiraceae bacterium TWA4]|nr:Phosphoglycolate phosphatase [Lachnospiraceae bacterium TWA4]